MSHPQVESRSFSKIKTSLVSRHNHQNGIVQKNRNVYEDKGHLGVDLVKDKDRFSSEEYKVSHRGGSTELKLPGLIRLFTQLSPI